MFNWIRNLFRKPVDTRSDAQKRIDAIKSEILKLAVPAAEALGNRDFIRADWRTRPIILNEPWMLPPQEEKPAVFRVKRVTPYGPSYVVYVHPDCAREVEDVFARERWKQAWRLYRLWCTDHDVKPLTSCRNVLSIFGERE